MYKKTICALLIVFGFLVNSSCNNSKTSSEVSSYQLNYYIADSNNPVKDIDLFLGEEIIDIDLGGWHSILLTSKGRVFVWGKNTLARNSQYKPIDITYLFLKSLNEGEKVIKINAGQDHSSALTSNGRVFMWGYNTHGQFGVQYPKEAVIPIDIIEQFSLYNDDEIASVELGDVHSSALSSKGRVFTWGFNYDGRLGYESDHDLYEVVDITDNFKLSEDEKVVSLNLGYTHSSALTSSGRLFMWGENEYGQVGNGLDDDIYLPTDITTNFVLNDDEKIISVKIGRMHSSALTSYGRVFTWGKNEFGQLGDGTF